MLLSILSGTVYLLLSVGGFWEQEILLRSQRELLEELANEQVPGAMRELADHGTAALPEIVNAMGSHRASVAMAAQQVILDEMDRLENLPPQQAAQARLILATSLTQEIKEFGPTTTRLAAYIAERLLRDDISAASPSDRTKLIDACGQVMRYASLQVGLTQIAGGLEGNWHETPQPLPWEQTLKLIEEEKRAAQEAADARLASSLTRQADGDIGPDGVIVPSLPDAAAGAYGVTNSTADKEKDSNSAAELEVPRGLPDPRGERVTPPASEPDNFHKPLRLRRLPHRRVTQQSEDRDPAMQREDSNAYGSLNPLESEARQQLPSRPHDSGASPNGPPRDETVIKLLQDLVAADEQAANRAASALEERGISEQHLELAKRLAYPDPQVRKSLVDALPRTPGLNARPWLMWLARDEDADVRLAAMNMLSTSQDPRLCSEIEELARGDRDERIVELAERLAKRRSKKY